MEGVGRLFGREGIGGGLQHHLVRQLTEDHEVLAGEAHLVGGTEPIVELHHHYEPITLDTVRRVEALPIVVAEPDDPLRRMLAKSAI